MESRWINTASGKKFWPLEPVQSDIRILDIAHALSHVCRFSGHSNFFYSVAQHCCYAHDIAGPTMQFAALMHDSAEAYLGDLNGQLKPAFPEYQKAETRLLNMIFAQYRVPVPEEYDKLIKEIDHMLLAWERRELFHEPHDWGLPDYNMDLTPIVPWSPAVAKEEFMNRFWGQVKCQK